MSAASNAALSFYAVETGSSCGIPGTVTSSAFVATTSSLPKITARLPPSSPSVGMSQNASPTRRMKRGATLLSSSFVQGPSTRLIAASSRLLLGDHHDDSQGHCCRDHLLSGSAPRSTSTMTMLYYIRQNYFVDSHSRAAMLSSPKPSSSSPSPSSSSSLLNCGRFAPANGGGFNAMSRACGVMRQRRCTSGSLSASAGGAFRSSEEDDADEWDESEASSRSRFENSLPGHMRRPPEVEDMWSKSSVFEFKSVNDPDTNTSMYRGFNGDPSDPSNPQQAQRSDSSSARRASASVPRLAGEALPTLDVNGGDEEARAQQLLRGATAGGAAYSNDDDWFKVREKEEIATTTTPTSRKPELPKPEVARRSRVVRRRDTAVAVELATQLGLPATSTYEEFREAYRAEAKRCHPDLAGDNEFRVKFLERRFQKLASAWEKFKEEHKRFSAADPSREKSSAGRSAERSTTAEGVRTIDLKEQVERARARTLARAQAEAKAEEQARQEAASAASQRSRNVMDPGREILDVGGSSC